MYICVRLLNFYQHIVTLRPNVLLHRIDFKGILPKIKFRIGSEIITRRIYSEINFKLLVSCQWHFSFSNPIYAFLSRRVNHLKMKAMTPTLEVEMPELKSHLHM
jgi:hypothetical protein